MKIYGIVFISTVLVMGCVTAAPNVQDNQVESDSAMGLTIRYFQSCFDNDDLATCLAAKSIAVLNRAARSNDIQLAEGISFKRDAAAVVERNSRALSENDIYAQLPSDSKERMERLIDMGIKSASDFISSHNLEVKFPAESTQQLARALNEGRTKMKKMFAPIILAIGAKMFGLLPILLGGLALLTTKAVIVAKIALVLAAVVSGLHLFGGSHSKKESISGYSSSAAWPSNGNGGWYSASSSSYPYGRNLNIENEEAAQRLAYAEQINSEE